MQFSSKRYIVCDSLSLILILPILTTITLVSCAKAIPVTLVTPVTPVAPVAPITSALEARRDQVTRIGSDFISPWDGSKEGYCRLEFDPKIMATDYPEFANPDLKVRHTLPRSERISNLIREGQLQEAIFLLTTRSDYRSFAVQEKIKSLQKIIFQAFSEGLRNGKFRKSGMNIGGSTKKAVLDFDAGFSAVFKYNDPDKWWANETSEVVAYLLDQMWDLNFVPATAYVKFEGSMGSIQYFVKGLDMTHHTILLGRNFRKLKIFDWIIGQPDRQISNVLEWRDEQYLVAIDNGAAFVGKECGTMESILEYLRYEPDFRQKILETSDTKIKKIFKKYLRPKYAKQVLTRIADLKRLLSEPDFGTPKHKNESKTEHRDELRADEPSSSEKRAGLSSASGL